MGTLLRAVVLAIFLVGLWFAVTGWGLAGTIGMLASAAAGVAIVWDVLTADLP
jgi:hypothetical protein